MEKLCRAADGWLFARTRQIVTVVTDWFSHYSLSIITGTSGLLFQMLLLRSTFCWVGAETIRTLVQVFCNHYSLLWRVSVWQITPICIRCHNKKGIHENWLPMQSVAKRFQVCALAPGSYRSEDWSVRVSNALTDHSLFQSRFKKHHWDQSAAKAGRCSPWSLQRYVLVIVGLSDPQYRWCEGWNPK